MKVLRFFKYLNKNDIIVFILTIFVFSPCLFFVIYAVDPRLGSILKQIVYFSFALAVVLLPMGILKPKIYFGFNFLLLPFIGIDIFLILLTKKYATTAYYTAILHTNITESKELLQSHIGLFSLGILSLVCYAFLWIKLDKNYKINTRNKSVIFALSLLVILMVSGRQFSNSMNTREKSVYSSFIGNMTSKLKYTYPFGPINRISNVLVGERILNDFKERNKNFSYEPELFSNENQTVVLVLGETARKHNFQLYGYDRNTNPELSKLKNLIIFKETTTNANYTHISFPLIMSSSDPKNYNIYNELGVIAAFKEAGFQTYWITNQDYSNGTIYQFYSMQADYFMDTSLDVEVNSYDEKLLPFLEEILNDGHKKQFVVLHTMGSHYGYHFRYPKTFSKYVPEMQGSVVMSANNVRKVSREMFVNSYDNSILYTDHVLSSVVKKLKDHTKKSIMIFVSDHGENLYDDDKELVLHGGLNPSKYELEIPMIIWYSDQYNKEAIKMLKLNSDKKISSSVVFHTLSSLGGFKTKFHQYKYDLLSNNLSEGNRLFVYDENRVLNIDN